MGLYLAGIVLCVILSAFFSASELAFSGANRVRLEHMAENGNRAAAVAGRILENFDAALASILVGNNLVNIAASSLSSVAAILFLGARYTWVATVCITLAVIIFGETIPKITAQKNATRYSLLLAYPVRFLTLLLRPVSGLVVALVGLLTGWLRGEKTADPEAAVDELHSIIETAEDEDVLDEGASELVNAAIDFSEITAQEVMTARVDLLAIDVEDSWEELLETVETSPYSRIPVYEDSIDNVIGILSLNHFLKALIDTRTVNLRSLLLPVSYVYKTMKLPAVLSLLRESQQHLAVVTDEYGGTLGVVSLEDVLEELVGDIWDETDVVEGDIEETADGIYEVAGDTLVSELVEAMGWDEETFDFVSDTVGGWCIEMLEGFPEAGANFNYQGATVTVLEADERRVQKVRIARASAEPETE